MTYFTAKQHAQLLRPINPARVSKDGKNFSHVEAYEIRAHLNRVIGFARWSEDLTDLALVFETSEQVRKKKDGKEYGDPYTAWTVLYRATIRLTVCAPDGTVLATYTEAATGEAKNQPSRGDAHDLALKTAESQALKRCAVNLGDNYGISLYAKGSLAPLVKGTLVTPDMLLFRGEPMTEVPDAPVDAHLTEQLPAESTQADDNRETNEPKAPRQERTAQPDQAALITAFRNRALSGEITSHSGWARLQMEVSTAKLAKAKTTDGAGNEITLLALVQACSKAAAA